MDYVIPVVSHTPIWVWAVLALVVILGLAGTRDRSTGLTRLLLLPGVMALLALSGLVSAGLAAVPAIVVGLVIGGSAGWLLEREGATRRLADGRVWLRGEWLSLLLVLVVFVWRYAINVIAAVNPTLAATGTWHLLTAFVSALLAALFLARTAARLRAYYNSAPLAA